MPGTTDNWDGAVGAYVVRGVPVAVDAGEDPTALTASRLTVYAVPLLSPDTTALPAVAGRAWVPVTAPTDDKVRRVYPVNGEPPSLVGGDHVRLSTPERGVTDVTKGARGACAVRGTTGPAGADSAPVPTLLLAVTVTVYGVCAHTPVSHPAV